jgi:hypothetical protein
MGQDIGIVESGHGQFGKDHLGESRECTGVSVSVLEKREVNIPENTVSVGFEGSESGSSGKVASLHDTTRNEYPTDQHGPTVAEGYSLWVALVDTGQSGRSLQIRINNHDLALVLLLASLVQYCRNGISKLDSTSSSLFGTSD